MVRQLLLCLPLLLLTDRIRAAEPPPALVAAVAQGRALRGEARATALGHLAWAAAVAGQPALARELAGQVAQEKAATVSGLAWSAAGLARSGAADEAVARFQLALSSLPKKGASSGLRAWFAAWSAADEPAGRTELGQAWLVAVGGLGRPEAILGLLAGVAPSLQAAGLAESVLALPAERAPSLMAAEDAATILCALGEPARARQLLARAARAAPEEVDEFLVPPLVAAWRGEDATEELRALSKHLFGTPYAVRLVRLAEVSRRVEDKAPDGGALLRAALDDAWTHGPPAGGGPQPDDAELERMRLVVRLVKLAPGALPAADALALLDAERRRAKERERAVYVLNEHLGAQAEAAGRVGGTDALALVRTLADDCEALAAKARASDIGPPGLVHEAAGTCAEAAGQLGGEGAAAVVDAIARRCAATIEGLTPEEREESDGAPLFHAAVASFRCAKAAVRLGRSDLAGRAVDAGLAHLAEGPSSDVPDALVAALEAVAGAPEPLRGELTGRIVARFELASTQREWAIGDLYHALAAAVAAPR